MSESPTTLIAIAGASGAGKSSLAGQLCSRILGTRKARDVSIIHEDNYYRAQSDLPLEQRWQINYDHPDALEHELLVEHLHQLKLGQPVQIPQYNYSLHTRKSETIVQAPSKLLIVEGILVLHDPKLRQLFDLKIYVDVPLDICLIRRLRRDLIERGDHWIRFWNSTRLQSGRCTINSSSQPCDTRISSFLGEAKTRMHSMFSIDICTTCSREPIPYLPGCFHK